MNQYMHCVFARLALARYYHYKMDPKGIFCENGLYAEQNTMMLN